MKSIFIHAWRINKVASSYYLIYTHWLYLKEISQLYDKVYLLSPTHKIHQKDTESFTSIDCFENIEVIELPPSSGYIGAVKYFSSYLKAYYGHKEVDTVYARYPTPFGWLQRIFFRNSRRIIHFVGDPVDTVQSNPNFSLWKKRILTFFFKPEYWMYLWACRRAEVYTNGQHLAEKIGRKKVNATPLISSTLSKGDFYYDINKNFNSNNPRLLYIGYLRKAKGVDVVIKAFSLLKEITPEASLTIAGAGEFELGLKTIVEELGLKDVTFLGHIEDRNRINDLLRSHDVFCFASLSEGSPRVVLEAMANGIPVLSTPVGSLPNIFTDSEDILFAEFNNEKMFSEKLLEIITNKEKTEKLRARAYEKVNSYTFENFINKIFHET